MSGVLEQQWAVYRLTARPGWAVRTATTGLVTGAAAGNVSWLITAGSHGNPSSLSPLLEGRGRDRSTVKAPLAP